MIDEIEYLKDMSSDYKDGFNKGISQGYEVGYEVAQKDYMAFYDGYINIEVELDYFRNEFEAKFDKEYVDETETFILSIGDLHHPNPLYILSDKYCANNLIRLQVNNYQFIHFVKFIFEIYFNGNSGITTKDTVGRMKTLLKLAQNLLQEEYHYYSIYNEQLNQYQTELMKIEWERN